jgi:hypothetical protein
MKKCFSLFLLCLGIITALSLQNAFGPVSDEEKFSLMNSENMGQNGKCKNTNLYLLNKSNDANKQEISNLYGNLPLTFVENKGQIDERVRFCARSPKATVYFTPTEVVFHFVEKKKNNERTATYFERKAFVSMLEKLSGLTKTHKEVVLRVSFPNANPNVVIEGEEQFSGKVNVFRGNDSSKWLTNIPTYRKIMYRNLWEGIDLVYYGEPGYGLKYDLIVHPNVDAAKARFKYEGQKELSVNSSGELIISTILGSIVEKKPYIYQNIDDERKEIPGCYILFDTNTFAYSVSKHNLSYPLIIDPGLVYSTYLGGRDTLEIGYDIAVDSQGYAYVTGYTGSTNFPTTAGAYDRAFYFGKDVFITKFNPTGSGLIYSTYLGADGDEIGRAITIDAEGCAYVAGYTKSLFFPTTPNAYDRTYNTGEELPYDIFITKINDSGSALIYSTYLGGNNHDYCFNLSIDSNNCVYITGVTYSSDFPTTLNAYDRTICPGTFGAYDVFITKLNESGSGLVYSSLIGGSEYEEGNGIVVDGEGCAYITGYTCSVNWSTMVTYPTTQNAYCRQTNAEADVFVTKMNPSGTGLAYSTFLGSRGSVYGRGIAIDSDRCVYLTGKIGEGGVIPTTPGAYQGWSGGKIFITKINSSGNDIVYSSRFGGSGYDDTSNCIAIDYQGCAYITGLTQSTEFPTKDAYDSTLNGDRNDVFVTKMNSLGSDLIYSTYLGSKEGFGIAVDSYGCAYITGQAFWDTPTTPGAYDTSTLGNGAFVSKLGIPRTLEASSGDNGIVYIPGEGTFRYHDLTTNQITAKADHGYHFVNWTGTAVDAGKVADPNSQTTTIIMDADYAITANFERNETIYVDDNAVNDPGHGNPLISDPIEDGSLQHPLDAIQDALNAADVGIPIIVLNGIYKSTGNRDLNFNGKNLTLKSLSGAGSTIIDCEGTAEQPHRAFSFINSEIETSVVEGFTIQNGYSQIGGGIYCLNSSPSIKSCIIKNNTSTEDGGGIVCSNAQIIMCEISQNISGNRGGGIFCSEASNPIVIDSMIFHNFSSHFGGGICFINSDVYINRCRIENNVSVDWGGGADLSYCLGTLTNCRIIGNASQLGGGMTSGKSVTIANTVIVNNTAEYAGGGLHCEGGRTSRDIYNCTIVGNSAGFYGGGIHLWDESTTYLTNSILWNNAAPDGHEIALTYPAGIASFIISFNDIKGGQSDIYFDIGWTLTWGTGNINTTPLFISELMSDYHLQSLSLCIDAGDPVSDYSLEPLPNGCRIDMGAYGNTPEATKSPGDVDNDLDIDVDDLILIHEALGSTGFDPRLDIDADGVVTFSDLRIAHSHMCGSLQYMGGVSTLWALDYMTPTDPTVQRLNPYINQSQLDNDADGKTNYEEYIAGTDPTDASSLFEITDVDFLVTINGNTITISWPAIAGKNYCLYYANTPKDMTEWLPVEGDYEVSDGIATQVINIDDSGPVRFFKVKVW